MAHFVEEVVELRVGFFAVGFSGDDGVHSSRAGLIADFFRIVAFVGDEIYGFSDLTYNFGGSFSVVSLTASDCQISKLQSKAEVDLCSRRLLVKGNDILLHLTAL